VDKSTTEESAQESAFLNSLDYTEITRKRIASIIIIILGICGLFMFPVYVFAVFYIFVNEGFDGSITTLLYIVAIAVSIVLEGAASITLLRAGLAGWKMLFLKQKKLGNRFWVLLAAFFVLLIVSSFILV
jgi:hypothetical protein